MGAMKIVRVFAVCMFALALSSLAWYVSHAAALLRVSDLISTSRPNATSTHTIHFTLTQAIPPSGTISITPTPGQFSIPAGFDFTDIDVAVSSGGPYVDRPLASTASASDDGVAVTTGLSGAIVITLSSSLGIAAGEKVQVELGDNATFGVPGDELISNPATTGSRRIFVVTRDAGGTKLDDAQAMVAIVQPVSTLLLNENAPPTRSNGLPTGTIAAGNDEIEISLQTDEIATCRYSTTPGVAFGSMTSNFTGVGGQLFFANATGHLNNTTYTYYVRCRDYYDVVNDDDYPITFSLATDPVSNTSIPGPGDAEEDTDPGPIPDGADTLYRSKVTLSGRSSPQSTVYILKDGSAHSSVGAGQDGVFTATILSLERGAYTFQAYAVDRGSRKSAAYSSTLTVTQGTNNTLSDIIIPPTIALEKEIIEPGESALLRGETVQKSAIEVSLSRTNGAAKILRTTAGEDGAWEMAIAASELERGVYRLKARALVSAQVRSDLSETLLLGVGVDPAEEEVPPEPGTTDINGDGKVNLVDFSIMLSAWGTSDSRADFNADGIVNLADFSILLFNWTG